MHHGLALQSVFCRQAVPEGGNAMVVDAVTDVVTGAAVVVVLVVVATGVVVARAGVVEGVGAGLGTADASMHCGDGHWAALCIAHHDT